MDQIEKYFNGERLQCTAGIFIALLSVSLAIYFLKQYKTPFYKGFAYPFIIIPVLLLVICMGIVFKSPGDTRRVQGFLAADKEQIQLQEIPRMEKVLRNFNVIKITELVLLATGILLVLLSGQNFFLKGLACGLSVQAVMMYIFDYVAEVRGKEYAAFLNAVPI